MQHRDKTHVRAVRGKGPDRKNLRQPDVEDVVRLVEGDGVDFGGDAR